MGRTAEEDLVQMVPGAIPGSELTALYRRQRTAMVHLARLLTRSEAVAEEVVQEAFLQIHARRESPSNPDAGRRRCPSDPASPIET
jgi:DNA-directed RNA polymerase specialized sigma24 family protein